MLCYLVQDTHRAPCGAWRLPVGDVGHQVVFVASAEGIQPPKPDEGVLFQDFQNGQELLQEGLQCFASLGERQGSITLSERLNLVVSH